MPHFVHVSILAIVEAMEVIGVRTISSRSGTGRRVTMTRVGRRFTMTRVDTGRRVPNKSVGSVVISTNLAIVVAFLVQGRV